MPDEGRRLPRRGVATSATDASGLVAEGLVAFRSDRLVLDGVSFRLPPGGALLLVGPNGAGKSTLLRVLAGLCRLNAGTVLWNGEDALQDPASHAERIGYLGHADALKPGLTLGENLRLAATLSEKPITPALEAFGLEALEPVPARLLSAGQKRRAALARVMLGHGALWLLDEPSLGLDLAAVARLGEVLASHRVAGGLVVATTHVPLPLPDAATLELGA